MATPGRWHVDPREEQLAWAGDVTWQVTAALREALFDALVATGQTGVRLDVREVRSIDRSGIALLVGANHRAAALGRLLVLTDNNGPVTRALSALHLLNGFHVTLVVTPGNRRTDAEAGSIPASLLV
ncbi:MAG: STAS domain-containing protein [Actinomycetes bacterium]